MQTREMRRYLAKFVCAFLFPKRREKEYNLE